ncbi:MAG: hypothetical protein MJ238_05645, partial [Bacilli bacterium]|nr:hypothetical protein [Bacilli bacterium]
MEDNEKKVKIKASSAASENGADSSSTGARTSALDKKYWKIKVEGLGKAGHEDEESPVTELETSEETVVAEEAAPSVEETIEESEPVEETPVVEESATEEEVVAEPLNEETSVEEANVAPAEETPVEETPAVETTEASAEEIPAVEEAAPAEEPTKEEEAPAPSRLEEMSDTYYSDVADSEKIKGKKASSVLKDSGYKETVLKEGEIVIVEEEENKPTPEEIEAAKEEEIEIPTEDRPVKFEVKEEPKVVENDDFDYIGKNKIIEDTTTSTIAGDEDISRLSELLGAGSVHTLRFRRRETGSFDMTWIRAIEDAIPAIDEILKNPRITTKIVTDIVPVELAKKTGSESVKHLASHTQFVKDIDEFGNVIPSKILNIGSDDEYLTYENKFVATCVRRLVLFIEKRYEYITKYSSLKDYEILYIKNHATVNGLDVDVQSKVVVSRPSTSGASMDETDGIMRRINLLRRYAKFFYASDFMKRFKNEKNTRSPIMQTNIIRKNPKYHKVYNLFRFMESYSALGVQFATKETYFGVEEEDKKTISNLSVANFLAVKAEPTSKDVTTVVETKTPEVLTNVDDDIFTFFPVGAYPEFIRIDEEYVNWRERNTKDLKENPSPEEKAYRGNDYLRKAKAERERKRREELIARREKARLEWFSEQERLLKEAEEDEAAEHYIIIRIAL